MPRKAKSPSTFPGSLGEAIVWDCVKLNALAAPTDEEQKRQLGLVKFRNCISWRSTIGLTFVTILMDTQF